MEYNRLDYSPKLIDSASQSTSHVVDVVRLLVIQLLRCLDERNRISANPCRSCRVLGVAGNRITDSSHFRPICPHLSHVRQEWRHLLSVVVGVWWRHGDLWVVQDKILQCSSYNAHQNNSKECLLCFQSSNRFYLCYFLLSARPTVASQLSVTAQQSFATNGAKFTGP